MVLDRVCLVGSGFANAALCFASCPHQVRNDKVFVWDGGMFVRGNGKSCAFGLIFWFFLQKKQIFFIFLDFYVCSLLFMAVNSTACILEIMAILCYWALIWARETAGTLYLN